VCGEGVAAVVLKPLRRALADGDPVYAVIRGTAVNQDGQTSGLTAPNSRAQERVLRSAYERAKIDPASVSYVEAHGTGTALGDPIELRALSAVFAGQPRGACGLGSVKGNVGHLEGAAGLASLIKVCLMLQHRTLVRSLHFERPSRHVDLTQSPFFVVDRTRPWTPRGQLPRFAGVSSFGFGGTNAHAVLTEAPQAASQPASTRERHLLVLSAHTPSALATLADRWRRLCAESSASPLASLCVSAATGRAPRAHRLAVVAGSHAELAKKLAEETSWTRGEVDARRRPRIAFLCAGQGSQQPRMAEALYRGEPKFRAALERCAEILRPHLDVPLLELLYPRPGEARPLEQTQFTQPAVFAIDWAMAQMWIAWGVTPSAVIGHSLGEYVAACLAGVMTIEEALPLVAARARLMQALSGGGAMAAVMTGPGELEVLLRGRVDVEVAAYNSPTSTVIAGDAAAVTEVCASLSQREIRSVPLPVSHAFHSRRMEPMLGAFRAHLRAVTLRPPRLPIVSNVGGTLAGAEMADPEYWVRQVRAPVRFADGITRLAADGTTAMLEVGPGSALTGLARECVRGLAQRPVLLASLGRDGDDWAPVLAALGKLWTLGTVIDWEATRAGQARVHVPVTPLERQRHGLVPAEAVEDVQVPLERQRLGDVPAVADARMANERPVSPGVGGQAGDGAVAAGIGAREGREGAVAASVGGRAGSEAGRGGAQGELLAALQGGRISVREAMDALLRGRT
jgi:acyl transferase domain-containing protein